jgi:uncharacterized membrane protein
MRQAYRDQPQAWRALTWLGLSLAAVVGMAQVGAIVQQALPTGALPVTTLFAPGQVGSGFAATSTALSSWADASLQFGSLWFWLCLHLLFDVLFIAGYGFLGFTLLPESEKPARRMLTTLIVADVVEDVLAALAFTRIRQHHGPNPVLTDFLHVFTVIKWLATLILLVRLVFWAWDNARDAIGRLFLALWEQRFSVIVVAFLAVLATGRGSDVLEQMPDVQRSWLTAPGMGWIHAGVSVIAQLLLAALLLSLGRMCRRRAAEESSGDESRDSPGYWPWILAPTALAVLAVLALLAAALGIAHVTEFDWGRLGVAIGVPVLVVISSAIIEHGVIPKILRWPVIAAIRRRFSRRDRVPVAGPGPGSGGEARQSLIARRMSVTATTTAGDALAVAVIAVTGLGLVRSFTAPAILARDGYAVASWVAVGIGIASATCIWLLANGPVRTRLGKLAHRDSPGLAARFVRWASQGQTEGERAHGGGKYSSWPWLVAGAPFLVASASLLIVPLWTTKLLGVFGTTVIATGTLAVILAVLAHLAQTRKPLPVFRALRLNVTPVITLIALIGLAGTTIGSSSALHDIRGPVIPPSPGDPPSLLASLDTWLDHPAAWMHDPPTSIGTRAADCSVPAAGGTSSGGPPVRIRPLILVAAAGGGIRAAWWAEQALSYLAGKPCGTQDVFAVSSVSGGSVGMAVLDSAPTLAKADDYMTDIAGPDALAAGIDGLLLHDMIAGFAGLDLAAAQMPAGQRFSDRAGLIESAWRSEDARMGQAFPPRRPALPWRLLFNSTDAASGCRAIIADRALTARPSTADPSTADPSTADPGNLSCDLRSAVPGSGSFDFFAKLYCTRHIAMVTAAMLSARFPYITPSGAVASCDKKNVLAGQFVDGGYVDSSGLLTLADLIPGLTAEIRVRNAAAVAQATPGRPVTLVVPIVMYLGNSPRLDPVDSPVARIQESVLPVDAQSAASAQLSTSDTMLQRIQGMLGVDQWLQCDPARPACGPVESVAGQAVPYQVIFVSPRTEPRISAPLGWVLSAASRDALASELTEEKARHGDPCMNTSHPHACLAGVGAMGDLLQFIGSGT